MTAVRPKMFGSYLSSVFSLKSLTTLLLLSWRVEPKFVNNKTLIKIINDMKSSWIAGENDMVLPPGFMTVKPRKRVVPTLRANSVRTPDSFDAAKHFTACSTIIGRIRDQGKCESSWAVAAVSMLSDRTCIEARGSSRVHLSAEDVMTCCTYCRAPRTSSCNNSHPLDAIYFWTKQGVVTGGELDSKRGCKPYSRESYYGKDVECKRSCTNNRANLKKYMEGKHRGKLVYQVDSNERYIKSDIYANGPVVAVIDLYQDFAYYKEGVYQHTAADKLGSHSLKIIGWGEEKGRKYWLAANSWGPNFGSNGFIKFLRGENHCKIEENVVAGRVTETLSAREAMKKPVTGCANTRSLSSVGKFLLQALSVWTVKRTS